MDGVDHVEAGEVFCSQVVRDEGPARALVDALVGGDGDQEGISLRPCPSQMPYMSRMHDIEAAVALDEPFALGPQALPPEQECLVVEDGGVGVGHGLLIGIAWCVDGVKVRRNRAETMSDAWPEFGPRLAIGETRT